MCNVDVCMRAHAKSVNRHHKTLNELKKAFYVWRFFLLLFPPVFHLLHHWDCKLFICLFRYFACIKHDTQSMFNMIRDMSEFNFGYAKLKGFLFRYTSFLWVCSIFTFELLQFMKMAIPKWTEPEVCAAMRVYTMAEFCNVWHHQRSEIVCCANQKGSFCLCYTLHMFYVCQEMSSNFSWICRMTLTVFRKKHKYPSEFIFEMENFSCCCALKTTIKMSS